MRSVSLGWRVVVSLFARGLHPLEKPRAEKPLAQHRATLAGQDEARLPVDQPLTRRLNRGVAQLDILRWGGLKVDPRFAPQEVERLRFEDFIPLASCRVAPSRADELALHMPRIMLD